MNLLLKVYNIQNDVISTSILDHTKYYHYLYDNNNLPVTSCLYKYNDVSQSFDVVDYAAYSSSLNKPSGSMSDPDVFTPNSTLDQGKWYFWDGSNWIECNEASHWTCLAKETKITMVDSSLKNIEDIVVGDKVLTFNHELGAHVSESVYLTYKGENLSKTFTLNFSNNIELTIVGMHDLFEKESKKYVKITKDNVDSFIGKHFYNSKDNRYEELLGVDFNDELTEYYSIYTTHNLNCIANNMLSLPDDVDALVNLYEFNEDLSIDIDALNNDIKKYGLLEFEDCKIIDEVTYDNCNCKYLNIVAGKDINAWQKLKDDYINNKQ